MNVGFLVTEAGPDVEAGDYFTALEMGQALQAEFGWSCEYIGQGRAEARSDAFARLDLLVVMLDRFDVRPARDLYPRLKIVAWMRNWFNRWVTQPHFDAFDVLLCSSDKAVSYTEQQTGRRAVCCSLATNPARFSPGPRRFRLRSDYVFTGSRWDQPREIEIMLHPREIGGRCSIYGRGWEKTALRKWARGFARYEKLPDVYRSTKIVIDDANIATKNWGSVNSRVFDALASGALVVTNSIEGSASLFEGQLPSYTDSDSLTTVMRKYLKDSEARHALAGSLRDTVLARHTYAHRARTLASALG